MKKRTSPRREQSADSDRRPTPDRRRQAASRQSDRPHSGRGHSHRREREPPQRREETEMPRGRKRGNPNWVKQKALPAATTAVVKAPPPQREVIEIHTTRERKRNASGAGGVFSNPNVNKLVLAGSAVAGGGATLFVAEKMGLSPVWAGVATGGAAMAGASL